MLSSTGDSLPFLFAQQAVCYLAGENVEIFNIYRQFLSKCVAGDIVVEEGVSSYIFIIMTF